ncbi:MAG TPA: cytochrome c [Candidatus Nitrosotalea sp.]|nr:cytochrome c [Candidatus Nitrosotalea sp.]
MNLLRLAAAVLLVACVCACSSNKSSSGSQASSAAAGASAAPAAAGNGASVFSANCASCHGANGQGSPGVFPPLAANPVVTGDPKTVIHIVKYGLTTAITVGGKPYHGMMPAWSPQIGDADIAAVLTYVRSSWGNNAAPIAAADVSAVSK